MPFHFFGRKFISDGSPVFVTFRLQGVGA